MKGRVMGRGSGSENGSIHGAAFHGRKSYTNTQIFLYFVSYFDAKSKWSKRHMCRKKRIIFLPG